MSVDGVKRAKFDNEIPVVVKQNFETSVNCNGNGLCFNYDVNSPMCPSYKATKDRRNSPKGRAGLMREWLRLQGDNVEKLRDTNIFTKVLSTINKVRGKYDFSHEVKQSMDLCLACKACTTACPIKVDVPTFRAKFLTLYHQRYLRPLSDHLVANVESIIPKLAKFPRLANLIAFNPISNWVTRNVIGYVDAPRFSGAITSYVSKQHWYNPNELNALTELEKSKFVLLVQDPFTSFYEGQLVQDTITALERLGFQPRVLPFTANGKAAHVKGFINKFKNTASKTTEYLNQAAKHNVAMIGLDASLVFAYRDEYVKELGTEKVKFDVSVLSEWLAQQDLSKVKAETKFNQYKLIAHCTEKSLMADVNAQWDHIFGQLNIPLTPISAGCCGMAGTFGHEKANQIVSKDLYQASWEDKVTEHKETLLATGFSCRSQVKRFSQHSVLHPIQVIASLTTHQK